MANIKKKSQSALKWFNNVGKSLGYSSMDLIEELLPSTMEFTKSNVEAAKDVYNVLKQSRVSGQKINRSLNSDSTISSSKDMIKNALNDLKTGKFYNKERQEKVSGFDDEDFSFSDDFSFDDSDDDLFNEDSFKDSKVNLTKNVTINNLAPNLSKNSPLMKVMEGNTKAILQSAESTNAVNISLASNKMIMDRKFSNSILSGLNVINENLSLLVNFQSDSMTKYISASLKYYEDNLKVLNDTLTEIKKTSTDQQLNSSNMNDNPFDMALNARGSLNVKGYMDLVKKNLDTAIRENPSLSMLKDMFDDKDAMKYMMASPLSFITSKLITVMVPNALRKSLEEVDKSFSGFFPAMLMKINRMANNSDNPILQFIGQVFGADVKTKSSVDLSKYNKGPVAFDGYTKKAIVEVIPGYLSKILSALTGKEDIGFDYDQGTFKTINTMKKEFEETEKRTILNAYSDVLMELKERSKALDIRDRDAKKSFEEGIEKFFMNLTNQNHLINPRKMKDKDGFEVDELADVFRFNSSEEQRYFRQLVLSMPKNMQMQMFGSNVADARRSKERLYRDMEDNSSVNNASYLFNKLGMDDHLDDDKKLKKGFGILSQVDRFNLSSLDYLRDIRKILSEGIVVYPNYNGGGTGSGSPVNPHSGRIKAMKDEETYYNEKLFKHNTLGEQSASEKMRRQSRGQLSVDNLWGVDLTDEEMRSQISTYMSINDPESKPDQNNSFGKWFGTLLKGSTQDKYNLVREKVDSLLKKPGEILTGVVKRIDSTLYKVVFGSSDEDEPSLMSKAMTGLREQFGKMTEWINTKIITPLQESLFGKDGMITKLKDSDLFRSAKSNLSKFGNYLFGTADGDGKRHGGLFSDTANSLLDMLDYGKYYFTGKAFKNRAGFAFAENENSVFGELKSMFGHYKDVMKTYLFGKKAEDGSDDESKGALSGILDGLKQGFQNFSDAIFGPKMIGGKENKNFVAIKELTVKLKERAPKALATGLIGGGAGLLLGGKLGLLGSIFLPGGPIGGAILGTAVGFLSQSEKFKNFVFGEKDENGERTGGLISKKFQNFMKENKVGLIGGATLGAAKSILGFGLLPSFLLPGGPIGGAILGAGISIARKSEKFQEFMFGTEDEDGKKIGGLFSGIYNKIKLKDENGKNLFGNMGAGALGGAGLGLITSKLGIMGAMLLPGGPLGGALLGAATGIAISSDKWKKVLFGEFDEDTQLRKGGLFGKFINWTKLEIFEPLKIKFQEINLNIKEWFTKSIANPFTDALSPIKHEIKQLVKNMSDMFKEGWDSFKTMIGDVFEKHVGEPFGKFMSEKVMKPLKGFLNKIVGGIGKIFGSILSSPFAMLNSLASGLRSKHERQGVEKYQQDEWSDLLDFKGRRQRGEKLGFTGGIKKLFGIYFNKDAIQAAKVGEHGASYANELDEIRTKRNIIQNQKFNDERNIIQKLKDNLNLRRSLGVENNFDNFSNDGKNISKIYKIRTPSGRLISKGDSMTLPVNDTLQQIPIINNAVNNSSNMVTNSFNDREKGIKPINIQNDRFKKGKYEEKTNTSQLISKIAGDVRIIAQEVKGQLDGLGSNTFKIRKLIQKQLGVDDKDLTGSSNRDRIGFFGKIRRALFSPVDAVKEFFMKGVRGITDTLTSFGETVTNVGKAIIDIPKKIITGFAKLGTEILKVGKDTFLEIIKLPGKLITVFAETAKIATAALKTVGPAIGEIMKGTVKIFSNALGMAGRMLLGFGEGTMKVLSGFGEAFKGIAKGVGETLGHVLSSIGKMLFTAIPMITETIFKATGMITKFALNTVQTIGKTLMSLVTSPFKLVGKLFGFGKKDGKSDGVRVIGGTIDKIKEVEIIKNISQKPLDVRIVDVSKNLPVVISDNKISNLDSSENNVISNVKGGASSFLGALFAFDKHNDKEEEEKKKKQNKLTESLTKKNLVGRKTSRFLQDQKAAKDEKEFTLNNEITQTNLLSKIANTVNEQKDSWLSILGPKGLITAGIILALPHLKTIMEKVTGLANFFILGEGNDSRTDADGTTITNSPLAESVTKGTLKVGLASYRKVLGVVKPVGKGVKNVFSKLTQKLGKKSPLAKKIVVETSEEVIEGQSGKIIGFVKKLLPKIFKDKSVVKIIGKEAAEKTSKEVTEKVSKTLTKSVLAKYGGRLSAAIASGAAKVSGAAASAGLTEAIFGVWNASTGAFEAHLLFEVEPENVDLKMRLISSAIKTILGFGFNFILEIISEIIEEVSGFDFIHLIANIMYKAMSSDDDYNKLLSAQNVLKEKVNEYNEQHGTSLSVDAYNEKYNKSVGQKIADFVSPVTNKIGKGFTWLADNSYKMGQSIADGTFFSTFEEGTKILIDDFMKKWTDGWGVIGESVSEVLTEKNQQLTDTIVSIGDKVKGFFGSILEKLGIIEKDTGISATKTTTDAELSATPNAVMNTWKNKSTTHPSSSGQVHSGIGGSFGNGGGFGVSPDSYNNFTYFSQSDDRWAKSIYDHSVGFGTKSNKPTISARGCGPTSMAMVVSQLTGKRFEPPLFAKIAQDGGYSSSEGTHWGFFPRVAKDFNLSLNTITQPYKDKTTIQSLLQSGFPIILSGKRTQYSKSDSPFTPGGHFVVAVGQNGSNGIVINDPRGTRFSKTYDMNKVLEEAKQAWAFNYTGGPLPFKSGNIVDPNQQWYLDHQWYLAPDETSTGTDGTKSKNFLDVIGGLSSVFQNYIDRIMYGDKANISTDQQTILTTLDSSQRSNLDQSFLGGTLKDKILQKVLETTIQGESAGRYSLVHNDLNSKTRERISPSLGIMQWREGNAKTLMNRMLKELPNDPDAQYYANKVDWYNRTPWSDAERNKLKDFFERNMSVTKKVQDQFAMDYMRDTNLSAVYKYAVDTGKITDPRAIAFLGDFANTGPGHVQKFMENYDATLRQGQDPFDAFYEQFKQKSHWGKNFDLYKSRATNLYNTLKEWDPEQGGNGEYNPFKAERLDAFFNNSNKIKGKSISFEKILDEMGKTTETIRSNDSKPLNDDLLRKMIILLEDISGNTKTTSDEIHTLNKKETKINVITENTKDNKPPTPVVVPVSNNHINPIIGMTEERRNNKQQKDYQTAKSISKGR